MKATNVYDELRQRLRAGEPWLDPLAWHLVDAMERGDREQEAEIDRLRAENERYKRVVDAAGVVWTWVGPGYPDLDDEEERRRFMASVSDVAMAWFVLQRETAPASDEEDRT